MVKPLDALISRYVSPVLREAGFTRRSRQFRRSSELGDYGLLAVPAMPSLGDGQLRFIIQPAVAPAPLLRFYNPGTESGYARLPPQQEHMFQLDGLRPPGRFQRAVAGTEWVADPDTEFDSCGQAVREVLATAGIPLLERLLVRDGLLAAIRANEPLGAFWEYNRLENELFCQVDRVPVAQGRQLLDRVLADENGHHARLAAQLEETYRTYPHWRQPSFIERFAAFICAELDARSG